MRRATSVWICAMVVLSSTYFFLDVKEAADGEAVTMDLLIDGPVHNIDKDTYYNTIHAGVDDADPGNTIEVEAGSYYEHVVVNKTLTLIGENRDNTIIDGGGSGTVVSILASNTTINSFRITGSGTNFDDRGIILDNVQDCIIENNSVLSNKYGISLFYANGNTISDNIANGNYCGIHIYHSNYCIITNNTVNLNNLFGMYIYTSHYNYINNNTLNSNGNRGIDIYSSSEYNIISHNTVSNNIYGISLSSSSNNNIVNNNASNNQLGIYLFDESNDNEIDNNNVFFNSNTGIELYWNCNSNTIYHNNIVSNNEQASDTGLNYWDIGYPRGGNYWSDYSGVDIFSGPGQNETGSDGIGDTPYQNIEGTSPIEFEEVINETVYGPAAGSEWGPFYLENADIVNCTLYLENIGVWFQMIEDWDYMLDYETGEIYLFEPLNPGDIINAYYNYTLNYLAQDNYPLMTPWPPDRAIMDLLKEASPHHTHVNDFVTYWINYTNSGSRIACNVTINDTYPQEISFVSATPPPDVGNNTWLIGDVSCGQSGSIMINVSVISVGIGIITNEVYLSYYNDTGHKHPTEYEEVTINTDAGPVHNIDKDLYYVRIQEAIDEADNGNTIEVDAGIYNEHVIVNKTLSLIGESRDNTTIDGGGSGNVVYLNANLINITGFSIINGDKGILIEDANNCSIDSNNISSNNWYGIDYESFTTYGNSIINNVISNNDYYGIEPFNRDTILNNQILDNYYGIYFRFRTNLTIVNNSMINCGLVADGYKLEHWITHTVYNNTVNGRPVYYWKNRSNEVIPPDAGQVILVNCTNIIVKNQNLSNASVGIELGFSYDNTITNNFFQNGTYRGLYAVESDNNVICHNNAVNNDIGMHFKTSHNNIVCDNNLSYCRQSINIESSDKNNVIKNKMYNCTDYNVCIWLSSYYNEIFNNDISNNTGNYYNQGIFLGTNPRYNNITYNKLYNTERAIYMYPSSAMYNTFSKNTIINCDYAITTYTTNYFYHNIIINASESTGYDIGGNSMWDDGYPSGGNYWSDYSGLDLFSGPNQDNPGSDGIGDTAYTGIVGNVDNYPLMTPLDCEPPSSSVNPIIPYWQTSSPIIINATASDNIAVDNVTLWYRYSTDNISWGSWVNFNIDFISPWSWNFNFPEGFGYYGFATIAIDSSGNPETPNNIICCEDVLCRYEPDTTPPSHSNEFPSIDGYCADLTPEISVHVTDMSGVNASTIRLYINGYMVFYNLTTIIDGYNVSYWHEVGFSLGDVVTCRIVADDLLDNHLDFTWHFTVLATFTVQLHEGWNLISFPLIVQNTSIESVLSSIAGNWDVAEYYSAIDTADHWKMYATFWPPSLNDLWNLNNTMGFWLHITVPSATLVIHGIEPTSTSIPLYAGWNLVGYPTLNTTTTVANALWGTGADRVEVCDSTDPYRTKEVGPTYVMKPGEGYWVHVPADTTWLVDW